jgi:glutathione S-transferase
MKRVPAIVDTENGLCLAESHSILKYLAQKYQAP